MKRIYFAAFLLSPVIAFSQAEKFPVDSASMEIAGVPKGELLKFQFENSNIFPGTWREYWVYVPAQYKPGKPACVYINQDGIQWKAPTVFDNLIYKNEMPVTIGVFISPGRVIADSSGVNRFNRSFEYDGLGEGYARFILDEILPEVEKKKTSDGREIRLSKNGNDRAIGGSSSGAVCAFTAAWECPEEFSKVFSAIGTYIGLRGADRYPTLIRKYEPKPIRMFLQDGSNDLNIYAGDWWKANEMMKRSLDFAGYEVNHSWGEGGHNNNHGSAVFPAAMRWLWKDWPKPIDKGVTKNQVLHDILLAGEDWELVGQGYKIIKGMAVNAKGEVYFVDKAISKNHKIGLDGKISVLPINTKTSNGICFGPDGKRYIAAAGANQIFSYNQQEKLTPVAGGIAGNDIIVASNGNMYVTAIEGASKTSKLYLIRPDRKIILADELIKPPGSFTLSPDQTQLFVTESNSHWIWAYKIRDDGRLIHKQRYGWLHVSDTEENAGPNGLKCDTAGRIFVSTGMGVQVLDQLGRVNAIMALPVSGKPANNLCFGGSEFNFLYVAAGDKIFRRKLKTRGANSFDKPFKPGNARM